MTISIGVGKSLDKMQHPFITKTLSKLGIEENYLDLMQRSYKSLAANNILEDEGPSAFSIRLGRRQGCLFSSLLPNTVLEVLVTETRQEKMTVYRSEWLTLVPLANSMAASRENS